MFKCIISFSPIMHAAPSVEHCNSHWNVNYHITTLLWHNITQGHYNLVIAILVTTNVQCCVLTARWSYIITLLYDIKTLFVISAPSSPTLSEHHEDDDVPPSTKGLIISDDPAQWPDVLSHSEKCDVVKKGPVQVKDMVFPQNTDKGPRRFTKESLQHGHEKWGKST